MFVFSRLTYFFFYVFLSFSLIYMTIGEAGRISRFFIFGAFFSVLLFFDFLYRLRLYKIKIKWSEATFYLYVILMLLSTLWSINPRNTILFASISAIIYTSIYFFICRIGLWCRIQVSKKLSIIFTLLQSMVALSLYFKHGYLRGPDIPAFGLNIMYIDAIVLPFLIMQLIIYSSQSKKGMSSTTYRLYFSSSHFELSYKKIIILIGIAAIVIVSICTQSRLAIINFILIPTTYLLLYYGISAQAVRWIAKITFFLVIIACSFFILKPNLFESFYSRLITTHYSYQIITELYTNPSSINCLAVGMKDIPELGRILMYRNAYDIITTYPVLGVGYKNAAEAGFNISGYGITIHNFFLGSFVEMGILGFILSILLVFLGLCRGFKKLKFFKINHYTELHAYYAAALTAFIVSIIVACFQPSYYRWPFYYVFALIFADDRMYSKNTDKRSCG